MTTKTNAYEYPTTRAAALRDASARLHTTGRTQVVLAVKPPDPDHPRRRFMAMDYASARVVKVARTIDPLAVTLRLRRPERTPAQVEADNAKHDAEAEARAHTQTCAPVSFAPTNFAQLQLI